MLANVLMLCTTNAVAEFVNKLTGERGGGGKKGKLDKFLILMTLT